jgi:hypothetical protein
VEKVVLEMTRDDLEYYRKLGMDVLADLVLVAAEQRSSLLSALVNKFGDSSKKVQQHAIQVLSKVLNSEKALAGLVVQETSAFVRRAGLKPVQKYYGI